MNFSVFGGIDATALPPGWDRETIVSLFGEADLDLTQRLPGPDATLTVFVVFGGIKATLPSGARASVSGFSLFGGRRVRLESGDGPTVRLSLWALFGGVDVGTAKTS